MEAEFKPRPDEYVYVQLAEHLVQQIEAGRWVPGDRLPGHDALAETYGVALGTARKAVRLLRERGVLVSKASLGTFVAPDLKL